MRQQPFDVLKQMHISVLNQWPEIKNGLFYKPIYVPEMYAKI
jgi:hypothetical protein